MLKYIELHDVGPAAHMRLDFAPRLNVLTGDNGLGKTLALDVAWWALTGTWAGTPPWPHRNSEATPKITFSLPIEEGLPDPLTAVFDVRSQQFDLTSERPAPDAVVIYARVDDGFALWDPAKYQRWPDEKYRPGTWAAKFCSLLFSQHELWEEKRINGQTVCRGLIEDWVSWQFQKEDVFRRLASVLGHLSPSESELLAPGPPTRVSIDDVRDHPTLVLPYGVVPLTHASAAICRIVSLAYLMVWAWTEHREASKHLKRDPTDRLVLLMDEVEAHLHPQWQRSIVPALLTVAKELQPDLSVQIIASTHAPLVLASVETVFDEEQDRLLTFGARGRQVMVEEIPWAKQGDAVNWLVSEAFCLKQARSRAAEVAIEAAEAFMRGDQGALPSGLETKEAIHQRLAAVLPDHDPFWPRWIVQTEGQKQ